MASHPLNLAGRFFLELALLFAFGLWGWQVGQNSLLKLILAAGFGLLVLIHAFISFERIVWLMHHEKTMHIDHIDHLVLTVEDIEATCAFYARVLGMQVVTFAGGRKALQCGKQKINLHQKGKEIEPRAHRPTPGSADLCLVTSVPLEQVITHLHACHVPLLLGPVERTGATTSLRSIYFRDPDGNLLEVANPC